MLEGQEGVAGHDRETEGCDVPRLLDCGVGKRVTWCVDCGRRAFCGGFIRTTSLFGHMRRNGVQMQPA